MISPYVGASSRACPSRAVVLMTRKEKRWKLWEDAQCASGCMLDTCGKEGEADVPCCVRYLPYSQGAQVHALALHSPDASTAPAL